MKNNPRKRKLIKQRFKQCSVEEREVPLHTSNQEQEKIYKQKEDSISRCLEEEKEQVKEVEDKQKE